MLRIVTHILLFAVSACHSQFSFLRQTKITTPAVTVELASPSSRISTDASPVLRLSGLKVGAQIEVFIDQCRTPLRTLTAQSPEQEVALFGLSKGSYSFYVRQSTSGTISECSIPEEYFVSGTPFVSTWQTTSPNETITLPLVEGYKYKMLVNWGDGSAESLIGAFDDPAVTHTYATPGTHTISIKGRAEAWRFKDLGDKNKILTVQELGDLGWRDFSSAFQCCANLTTFIGGNTSEVVQMSNMFRAASQVTPDIGDWDTSRVTNMSLMFYRAYLADPDVSRWNVSKVSRFNSMFYEASIARPDTSQWDTSSATDMSRLFQGALLANPDVSHWNTSRVVNMSAVFRTTNTANPDVSNWDTSNVTDMSLMFSDAQVARPVTTSWNTSSVTTMSQMFYLALQANPDTRYWDTSNVTDMYRMFRGASLAAPNTLNWNTSKVQNMGGLFSFAPLSNPDLTNWSFESVTDIGSFLTNPLSTQMYSNLLVSIATTSSQSGLSLSAPGSRYNATIGQSARATLVSRGWTIGDAGVAP